MSPVRGVSKLVRANGRGRRKVTHAFRGDAGDVESAGCKQYLLLGTLIYGILEGFCKEIGVGFRVGVAFHYSKLVS